MNVEKEIRSMEVANKVSLVARVPEVRTKLVAIQQRMAEGGGVVMDGRDIGTVVLPNAELKVFMTADPETRAYRRLRELQANGQGRVVRRRLGQRPQNATASTLNAPWRLCVKRTTPWWWTTAT